jgi:hypothetical protein
VLTLAGIGNLCHDSERSLEELVQMVHGDVLFGLSAMVAIVIYVFVKMVFSYRLITGELRFPWQNQFSPWYRGYVVGMVWGYAAIAWWPLTWPLIKQALKKT